MNPSLDYDRDPTEFFERCRENQTVPRNDALKLIVLERILDDFERGRVYEKSTVNDLIGDYFEDYTAIRRDLVNLGYLQYDNLTNEYTVEQTTLSVEEIRDTPRLAQHAEDIGVFD